MEEKEQLVKSKERVTLHGEVFTAEREVTAMLDLVKDEAERIDSRFLEPACGEGNFLVVILKRKLDVVDKKYGKHLANFEKYSMIALSSIYGVELLDDNATCCRERLYSIWNDYYTRKLKNEINKNCQKSAKYILDRNILRGDALTMLNSHGEPIIFSQWDLIMGNLIKRRDYRLDVLMENEESNNEDNYQIDFLEDFDTEWELQNEKYLKIPKALKEYTPIEYWRVFEHE